MKNEITIKLPRKVFKEILKLLPESEVKEIERQLKKDKNKKVPIFRIATSPFFSHKPIDLGDTSAEKIDKIIAKRII